MSISNQSRFGICQQCGDSDAKYTCPRCNLHTCSARCVHAHKEESGCSGQRNHTKYISTQNFTDLDLLSDYRLLEELTRSVEALAKESSTSAKLTGKKERGNSGQDLTKRLLKKAARICPYRNCRLVLLPSLFQRGRNNTSYFDLSQRRIFWHVQLIFPHINRTVVVEKVRETTSLHSLLSPFVNSLPPEEVQDYSEKRETNVKKHLEAIEEDDPFCIYKSVGFGGILALLKAEHLMQPPLTEAERESRKERTVLKNKRFYELDLKKSLRRNFQEKTIVEFPIIFVVLESHKELFSTEVVDIDILNMSTPQQKEVEEETSPNADDNAVSSDNWDNSDHQKTTAAVTPSPTGMTPQAASSDKEESFSRTYGLLGGDEEDEGGDDAKKLPGASELDSSETVEKAEKRKSEERCQEILRKHRRHWQRPLQEREDGSFVHAFALQEEQDEFQSKPEEKAPKEEKEEEKEVSTGLYQKQYDYYLNYYQKKYGVSAQGEAGAAVTTLQDTKEEKVEKSEALLALAGYADSDVEEEGETT